MSSHVPAVSSGGRIALAGATGRIGSALAASLVADPASVVALTRDPQTARLADTTAVVAVDFDQPGSLEAALHGAQRLCIAHGTSLRQVRNESALIDAAVKVGGAHVVKVSSMGPPSTLPPFAWHIAIEAHVATQPLGYTVLRPSAFVDILHRAGSQVAAGTWGGAAGEGLVTFIDTCDVAEVARAALLAALEPGTQRVHHLTGSRSWSMPQIAEELSRLLGRQILYEHRTPAAQRELLLRSGLNAFGADLLLGLDTVFRASALAETTSTVDDLTGHAPRSVPAWLAENRDVFSTSEPVRACRSHHRTVSWQPHSVAGRPCHACRTHLPMGVVKAPWCNAGLSPACVRPTAHQYVSKKGGFRDKSLSLPELCPAFRLNTLPFTCR